jgi:hypothetical protein
VVHYLRNGRHARDEVCACLSIMNEELRIMNEGPAVKDFLIPQF